MSQVQQLLTEHLDIWTSADTEKKSGRGRASGSAGKVYGIQKLRGLILDLAVRGKLVPQDPNDEPASELLKRIQTEKAKLIAEGNLKKEKSVAPIADDEKPFELPNGWEWVRFGDVVEIVRGITFPGSEKSKTSESGRIACLRTANVQDQIDWEDMLYIKEQFVSREDQLVQPNDIVMSMANSRELVGKVALVGSELKEKTTFGGFLGVIRPYSILPKFVLTLLRTPLTREALIDSASQTTNIANISLAKLRPLFFAIPPLDEQHRIVAKVDELMAMCDQLEQQHINATEAYEKLVEHLLGTLTQAQNAQEFNNQWQRICTHFDTLFTTEASIDTLKQTLLQLAVMGKLVPQDPNNEPASELLKRIQAEKAKLIAEGKLNKEKLRTPIADDEKPFELPAGWEWRRLGELFTFEYGDNLPEQKRSNTGEYPVYGSNGIVGTHEKSFVNSKCIVIGRKGSAGALNLSLSSGCCVTDVAYYCIPPSELDLMFTFKLFHTLGLDDLGKGIKPGLNRNEAYDLILAIPPESEQHRIVAKVDELMVLCDQLKICIQQSGQHQQQLADVLVAQAVA